MDAVTGPRAFMIFFARGLALWVLVPLASLAWALVHSWAQKATLGQTVCWYDGNLVTALLRTSTRRVPRARFTGISAMRTLETYKIGFLTEFVDIS